MKRYDLGNGYIKLVGNILDTRTKQVYSEVICKEQDEKYFQEVVEE